MIGVSHLTTEEIKVGLSDFFKITHCLPLQGGRRLTIVWNYKIGYGVTHPLSCLQSPGPTPAFLAAAFLGLCRPTWQWHSVSMDLVEGVLVDDHEKQCGCCAGIFLINQ